MDGTAKRVHEPLPVRLHCMWMRCAWTANGGSIQYFVVQASWFFRLVRYLPGLLPANSPKDLNTSCPEHLRGAGLRRF
jgi:hypothetical protein